MSEQELWAEFDRVRDTAVAGTTKESAAADGGNAAEKLVPTLQNAEVQRAMHASSASVRKDAKRRNAQSRAQMLAQARFHDGVEEQLHALWCAVRRNARSFTDVMTESRPSHERCEPQRCTSEAWPIKFYALWPDKESDTLLDQVKRQRGYEKVYLSDATLEAAARCGALSQSSAGRPHTVPLWRSKAEMASREEQKKRARQSRIDTGALNCIVHACVESMCVLPLNAKPAQRALYDRLHQAKNVLAAGAANLRVPERVYFCARHVRVHVCGDNCSQSIGSHSGERICALSARVLSNATVEHCFSDGWGAEAIATARRESSARARSAALNESQFSTLAFGDEPMQAAQSADGAPASTQRERPSFCDVRVRRDRGSLRGRRRRGRGRGTMAAPSERMRLQRFQLARMAATSSGDANALSARRAASEFERTAAGAATAATRFENAIEDEEEEEEDEHGVAKRKVPSASASKRKARRAKRLRTVEGATMRITMPVPLRLLSNEMRAALVGKSGRVAVSTRQRGPLQSAETSASGTTQDLAGRLAPDVDDAERSMCANDVVAVGVGGAEHTEESIVLSFNLRPRVPFADRAPGRYDSEFALDTLEERRLRAGRLARFRAAGAEAFGSSRELVAHFGERACAIFSTLYTSRQRNAIEQHKIDVALERARSDVDTYVTAQRRAGAVCSVEEIERLCTEAYRSSRAPPRLVIDRVHYAIVETYVALLVLEFYFNLVCLSIERADVLGESVVAIVREQCFFEHFVPAIISFMRYGLHVSGFTVLPAEPLIVRTLYPDTGVMKQLGMAEQSMTHLCAVIRQYVAAAERSDTPMRLLEATQLSLNDVVLLRAPSAMQSVAERMSDEQMADAAARRTVQLFVERRRARLASFTRTPTTTGQ